MRYLIDEKETEPEVSLALYRTILTWAASCGERFVLSLQGDVYDNPNRVKQFSALGNATTNREASPDFFSQVLTRLFGGATDIIRVEGIPSEAFTRQLTCEAAPDKAISGDVCPVEDVKILIGERILYACYDYGRDQILDLTDEEFEALSQILKEAGLDPAYLIPAPPYVTITG